MSDIELRAAAKRVERMERAFDKVSRALETSPEQLAEDEWMAGAVRMLSDYLSGGEWMTDYELDENGLLPRELKRGVLAQDALYNMLEEAAEYIKENQDGQEV